MSIKMFGLSRSTVAGITALLFIWAQTTAFAQNFSSRPQQAVVTKTDTYLPAAVQMVAQADTQEVIVHPQGRYALIRQNEAALPSGPLVKKEVTGAFALLLYDAKLRKTRTLIERRADGGTHLIWNVQWLPETDCALVVTRDIPPPASTSAPTSDEANAVYEPIASNQLLFFDFSKSLSPRILVSSQRAPVLGTISVGVSPTKPQFVVRDGEDIRMGNGPRGNLGPPASMSYLFHPYSSWDAEGTSIYGVETIKTQADPDAKPQFFKKWFVWDGNSPNATERDTAPTKAEIAQSVPPTHSPIALRTGILPIATSLTISEQRFVPAQPPKAQAKLSTAQATGITPSALLHPLYLEATTDPTTADANLNHSALIAPDADASYLLPDQSAVLYQSSGALYAVPLVHIKTEVYVQA